ncbi:MAG: Glu/Leu/Phe/Val dehydrogenase [Bacteroidia bacterium]
MSDLQLLEKKQSPSLFDSMQTYDHEMVVHCNDNASGLRAIVAVHNTTLGPAMGGVRMWNYASEAEAITDALRLSRGMTLKNALAGINVGGGKAVIIGDARKHKSEALLRRFGQFINNLNGKYYTAEDVGMTSEDMIHVHHETPFVTGMPAYAGGSGDPGTMTAYGVYLGIKASIKQLTGSDSLAGKRILIQGVGSVGADLAEYLAKEKAEIFIYDLYPSVMKAVVAKTGAKIIEKEAVYQMELDVFAPCALGASLNPDTIPQLNCAIIAGSANNQLLDEVSDAEALRERGILYAPDFLVNAGGIINVSLELEEYNYDRARQLTEKIYDRTLENFAIASNKNITTHQAALDMAQSRIDALGHNLLFC